jgi:hypothetical protein
VTRIGRRTPDSTGDFEDEEVKESYEGPTFRTTQRFAGITCMTQLREGAKAG